MEEKPKSSDNVNVNFDTTPILYTDNVSMTVNEDGVVLDFTQRLLTTNQVKIVARIGMSREHAKKFVEALETGIKSAESAMQSAAKKAKLN